jgi:hypothetical protein
VSGNGCPPKSRRGGVAPDAGLRPVPCGYERPTLSAQPLDGGAGCYVQVDWPYFSEQVGAFVSRAEAEEWIEHKSEEWLRKYQRPSKG